MYAIGAEVNTKRANYYLPVQSDDGSSPCKKRCEIVWHPPRTTYILGRKYALTSTSYKYLEIGISVGPVSTVELLISDNRSNQIILPIATWKTLMEKRDNVQRFLQATSTSQTSPLLIRDLALEYCKINNSNIVKLTSSNNCLYLNPNTMNMLFNFEHCIDHMYAWLCENTHIVNTKFRNFVNVLCEKNITDICYAAKEIGESEVCYATKAIRESEVFDSESLVDCELLACALKNIMYDALNK